MFRSSEGLFTFIVKLKNIIVTHVGRHFVIIQVSSHTVSPMLKKSCKSVTPVIKHFVMLVVSRNIFLSTLVKNHMNVGLVVKHSVILTLLRDTNSTTM